MRLDRIRLQNFACFESTSQELCSRFNLIVGDNAAGKTTWLNGISVGVGALFLGFPTPAVTKSIPKNLARLKFYQQGDAITAEPQFPVVVECSGRVAGQSIEWCRDLSSDDGRTTRQYAFEIRNISEKLKWQVKNGDRVILPVISFYGTGRLWVQKKQRDVKTLRPDSRFMGYLDCLEPASDEKRLLEWFKTQEIAAIQQSKPICTLEACRIAVRTCVPGTTRVYFDIKRDELMLDRPGRSLPFSCLSDGYRNMVAMVADIAIRCATLNPHLAGEVALQTPGVVLIDEIDLHLHPKWQRRVIGDLLKAFPNIQFIATTHSPFVIQSLPAVDGVQLINLDNPEADDFSNKSVEDITEEVQGVDLPQRSKRWQDMMSAAEEYYAVLRAATGQSPEEITRLKNRLDELSLPFSDDPAYQALLVSERTAAGLNEEPH
jgi:predicted ATP-binding protein involved in virulence